MSFQQSIQPNFSPLYYDRCTLWLDASDPTTITTAANAVSEWRDKSGLGNHAAAVSGNTTLSAINSLTTVQLNNTSLGGAISNTGPSVTAFVIATMENTTQSNGRLLSCGLPTELDTATNSSTLLNRLTTGNQVYSTRAGVNTSFVTLTYGVPFIMAIQYTGVQNGIYLNGSLQGSPANVAATFAYTRYRVGNTAGSGANAFWTGQVGEILLYNAVLVPIQRQAVEGYLAWKWGLTANLPATHPYKNRQPSVVPNQPSATLTFPLRMNRASFFDPRSISGMIIWLDTSKLGNITFSGTTVTGLRDQSGMGNNWSGSATLNRIGTLGNNLPTVSSMNGTTALRNNINGNQPMTYVWVCSGAAGSIFVRNEINFSLSFAHGIGATNISVNINQGGTFFNKTGLASVTRLCFMQSSGTTVSLYDNGTLQQSTAGTLNQTSGNTRTQGSIGFQAGEFMIFNKILSDTERQNLEGYFAWKWGLVANLPSNHPFRNNPLRPGNPIVPQPRLINLLSVFSIPSPPISFMYPTSGYSWYDMGSISGTTLVDVGTSRVNNGTMNTTIPLSSGPVANMLALNIPFGAAITMPIGYTSANFSICFWVNFTFKAGTGLTTYEYFLTGGRLQVHQYLRQLQSGGGDGYYYFYDTAGSVYTNPIVDSIWHHFVFVYNTTSNQVSLYRNGSFVQTTNQSIGGAATWTIGNTTTSGAFAFNGQLADLRIVSTLLTANQVTALYNSYSNGTWRVFNTSSLLTPR